MEIRSVVIYQKETCYPAVLRIPDVTPAPAVVFHIGYCAHMAMYDDMAEAFCKAGYVTLQYDGRTQMGRSSGYFRCGTEWLEDAAQSVSYVMGLPEVDPNRIGFAGLSMGGGVTLSLGSLDWRIKCLYAMAPVPDYKTMAEERWIDSQGQEGWDGFLKEVEEDAIRTAHGFPSRFVTCGYVGRGVPSDPKDMEATLAVNPHIAVELPLDSIFNVYMFMNAYRAAHFIDKPICLVHGTGDETIPYKYSQQIYDVIPTENKELHFIEGAGHVLTDCAGDEVIQIGLDWFGRWL